METPKKETSRKNGYEKVIFEHTNFLSLLRQFAF
jgi:hypothetical protein